MALLVLLETEAQENRQNEKDAALSVEFFHTASLIVDDLPCMDNEEERRNQPTLHKLYGESIALLSSYALICAAFEKIQINAKNLKESGGVFFFLVVLVGFVVFVFVFCCVCFL